MKRILPMMALALAFITLRGDNCVLENKNIDVPLQGEEELTFTSMGDTDSGSETRDFFQVLLDLEAEGDVEELKSAGIEATFWKALANRGSADTEASATVSVTRVSSGASAPLVSFSDVNVSSKLDDYEPAPVNSAGLDLLVDGFDDYVAWRNNGGTPPNLTYTFDWTSSGSPPPVDFDWAVLIKFVIVGVFEVEVPNL